MTKVLDQAEGKGWALYNGDCIEVIKGIPDASIGFSVFSPPFASLYTYTNSERDMGNCKSTSDFGVHFNFLIEELMRVTMPGRLCSFHCMLLPTSKQHHGYIGLEDFRGDLIRAFKSHGWIHHSEAVIWKDPVTAMQRTKALGLLHKQIVKDSCMSRQGVPDYLITMRKPGVNPNPVEGMFDKFVGDMTADEFESWAARKHNGSTMPYEQFLSVNIWQRYASPVWMDINPSDTLQKESAREEKDERHICPLQLQVIERALTLWSNPGDTVLSPFAGIGSEGFKSIKMGRKFIGIELKQSYYRQAVLNLTAAESHQSDLMPLAAGAEAA